MPNIFKVAVVIACLTLLAGCESRTLYGECVGIDADKDARLEYKLSVRNTVVGFIFIETIFVPVIVLVNETYCPVGYKIVP